MGLRETDEHRGEAVAPSVVPFPFDDFLALRSRDFSRDRLVVFTGRSGSGKSTAIRFLLEEHPDVRGRETLIIDGQRITRRAARADVVAVDDLTSVADLRLVWRLLRTSRTLLVASHLHPAWFAPLRALLRCSFFRTDADRGKLARYLAARGVAASDRALETFVAAFGATYTDLDIVLERCPARSLDSALAKFLRFNAIRASDPIRSLAVPES